MADRQSDLATRQKTQPQQQPIARRSELMSPFQMFDRLAEDMDRLFGELGLGRGWSRRSRTDLQAWSPRVDITQKDNELVVCADLPGMSKDDVKVDVSDNAITIQGERHRESEEERGGIYRSERSYGSFYREIPLPEGAMTDQAKATFRNGVLEIRMPAPPEHVNRGRRLEIGESGPGEQR